MAQTTWSKGRMQATQLSCNRPVATECVRAFGLDEDAQLP